MKQPRKMNCQNPRCGEWLDPPGWLCPSCRLMLQTTAGATAAVIWLASWAWTAWGGWAHVEVLLKLGLGAIFNR